MLEMEIISVIISIGFDFSLTQPLTGEKNEITKENKTLFKHTLTVAKSASGSFVPGLWSWVFSFKLPPELPASTFIRIENFSGAKMKAAVSPKFAI